MGVLGVIDSYTHFISMGFLFVFGFLFGAMVAAFVSILISTILGFSIFWFLPAYLFKKKSEFIENPSEENKKHLRLAKFITLIVFILLFGTMIFLAIISLNNTKIKSKAAEQYNSQEIQIID